MSLTNYYSLMGLQTEEPYGAHFIHGGLQVSSSGCAKPARGAEEEEGTTSSHFPDFSHFSNKQLNGFSSWTNSSSSISSSSTQLQSTHGLFHPHHLLNHNHPYYGPQTQTHNEAPSGASDGRFVRCWEGATPAAATLSHASGGIQSCVPAQGDLSRPSRIFEAVKPDNSLESNDSPADSSVDRPTEVVLERLGTAKNLERKPESKKEGEGGKTQLDPGKDRTTTLKNVY